MRKIFHIILLFLLCACAAKSKDNGYTEVKGDKQLVLEFDDDAYIRICGKDSSYANDSNNKVVIYVDSFYCSTCFLTRIVDYYDLNKKLQSSNASLVVIFSPNNSVKDYFKKLLKYDNIPFWCIVDENGQFEGQNPITSGRGHLQFYLLDKDNNIISMGNPFVEAYVKKAYCEFLNLNDLE